MANISSIYSTISIFSDVYWFEFLLLFGFYNIFGKFAAILGPFIMALTTTLTGQARLSILSIIPLFVIGLVVFMLLPNGERAKTIGWCSI